MQIFLRLIYEQKKAEIATEHYLTTEEWNDASQRAIKSERVNKELINLENRIMDIKSRLTYEGKEVSAALIKAVLTGKDLPYTDLITYYEQYLTRVEGDSNYASGTLKTYKKTMNLVKEFIKHHHGKEQFNIRKVNFEFIDQLHSYMCSQPGTNDEPMKVNTIGKHHSRFRTFLIYALDREKIDRNPYQRFSIKFEESDRTFLTREELIKMETGSLGGNKSLERVRDIFLFSVYTGLRFTDAQSLTMNDFTLGENGQRYFYHKEQKTGKHAAFPVLGPAEAIITKYSDCDERKIKNFVLPRISNQRCNDYIKTVADLVGISDKVVTHHCARHTCATTILLENGVSLDMVQAWMNHSNIRETMIYAKMTGRVIREAKSIQTLTERFSVRTSYSL